MSDYYFWSIYWESCSNLTVLNDFRNRTRVRQIRERKESWSPLDVTRSPEIRSLRTTSDEKNHWRSPPTGYYPPEYIAVLRKGRPSTPVLRFYRPAAETQLHTDACSMGLGAILLQKQADLSWAPVAYFSQATNDAAWHTHVPCRCTPVVA